MTVLIMQYAVHMPWGEPNQRKEEEQGCPAQTRLQARVNGSTYHQWVGEGLLILYRGVGLANIEFPKIPKLPAAKPWLLVGDRQERAGGGAPCQSQQAGA